MSRLSELASVLFLASLLLGFSLAAASPARAQAANASGTKIASVDVAKVIDEMQETKDLRQKMDGQRGSLDAESKDRESKVHQLQTQRDMLRPDSQQWASANSDLVHAAVELKTWREVTRLDLERDYKQHMLSLFNKVQGAVGNLAKQRGIDLVLSSQAVRPPDDVDAVTPEQLQTALQQRNVLYASSAVDLTADVTAQLDAAYKSGK